jgi:hypothetical protein
VSRNDKILLSDIHRCAVKEAMDDLSDDTATIVEPLYREEMLGHLKQYVSVIRNYQRFGFTERDIMLLRYLEAWCLYESNYYLKPIGTVSFELVWEDVLRGVFGHEKLSGKVGFGSPVYHIRKKNDDGKSYGEYVINGDSIPDVMNFWMNETEEFRFILIDGKYYLGQVENNDIYGVPGYKDVAKQIDYFNTLQTVYGLNADCGKNVFILPEWNGLCNVDFEKDGDNNKSIIRYVGYVEKPKINDVINDVIKDVIKDDEGVKDEILKNQNKENNNTKDKVHLIQVKPDELYQIFLNGVNSTADYANMLWDLIDNPNM